MDWKQEWEILRSTVNRVIPWKEALMRSTWLRFGALIVFAGVAALLTAVVLEIQAGANAYIVGEGHWSKAQRDAVANLQRYADRGDPADLAAARMSLEIPLGDLHGRLALERNPPDTRAARAGFLKGGNAPEDLGRLVWMFNYFATAPYFSETVRIWREADPLIAELMRISNEIEARTSHGMLTDVERAAFQARISGLDQQLRPMELAFSQSLVRGTRVMRVALLVVSTLIFVLIAWGTVALMSWSLRRIRHSEGLFRMAFNQAATGMVKLDRAGNLLAVNDALGAITGYSEAQLLMMNVEEFMDPDVRGRIPRDAGGMIAWEQIQSPAEFHFVHQDGGSLWARCSVSVIEGEGDERVFAVVEDVSETRQLIEEMKFQANHDDLTGMINRREIERRVREAIDFVHLTGEVQTLCVIDIDQFKLVNDTCGHAAGDRYLRQFAGTIRLCLGVHDWVGRLGGDEFAVLLHTATPSDARRVAEKINATVATNGFSSEGRRFNITCSIGMVQIDPATQDVGLLLRAADTTCYLAKEDGRNRVRFYEESDEAMIRRRGDMEWVGEIQGALANGRLKLYGQKLRSLHGDDGLHYEILLRLVDSSGTLRSPAAFLPAAELYDQSMAIDRCVLSMVMEQLQSHPQHLRDLSLCHVNLSGQSIGDPGFREFVESLLDASAVPAGKLCFEITETAAIDNLVDASAFIDAMRLRGCKIAIDDFGSGFSSYGYLKNLATDILKIDGIFVRSMASDPIDSALVRSITEVGHSLGKVVIAEWVESREVLEKLEEIGIDYVQGYLIHEPCPLEELFRTASTPAAA